MISFSVKPGVALNPAKKVNGQEYLVGHEYEDITINCVITNGTPPFTIDLYIDGEKRPSTTLPNYSQQLIFLLEPRHHLSRVNCTVNNEAGTVSIGYPLFALSRKSLGLYLVRDTNLEKNAYHLFWLSSNKYKTKYFRQDVTYCILSGSIYNLSKQERQTGSKPCPMLLSIKQIF